MRVVCFRLISVVLYAVSDRLERRASRRFVDWAVILLAKPLVLALLHRLLSGWPVRSDASRPLSGLYPDRRRRISTTSWPLSCSNPARCQPRRA